jgi:two-component system, NarL family, nitrate/nitrite response regulator NarL
MFCSGVDSAARQGHSLPIALVCRPQLLRLGLERLLGDAGFDVIAHEVPFTPPVPAAVGVLSERGLGDLEAVCTDARGTLADDLVVVFSRPTPEALLECLTAGVRGFTAEHDGPADLVGAVRAAASGEYHVAPGMLELLLDWHRVQHPRRDERARLRDRDLLGLLAGGASTQTIAAQMGIAPKTVRNRASLLYRRLGVRSKAEAARLAEERGLLD